MMQQGLLRRLANSPSEFTDTVNAVFGLSDALKEKVAAIQNDAALSPVGRAQAIKNLFAGGIGEHLKQIQQKTSKVREQISAERAGLAPQPPDKSDVFAEMQRAEIRAHLRTMTPPDRMHLARRDETAAAALLFAPVALGLFDEKFGPIEKQRADLTKALTETKHGAKMRELDNREQQIGSVESAIGIALTDMKTAAGLADQEFATLTSAA